MGKGVSTNPIKHLLRTCSQYGSELTLLNMYLKFSSINFRNFEQNAVGLEQNPAKRRWLIDSYDALWCWCTRCTYIYDKLNSLSKGSLCAEFTKNDNIRYCGYVAEVKINQVSQ